MFVCVFGHFGVDVRRFNRFQGLQDSVPIEWFAILALHSHLGFLAEMARIVLPPEWATIISFKRFAVPVSAC